MKLKFLILICIFFSSCSTRNFIELTDKKIKQINIPKNYTAIYCNCDNNPLLLKIISELKMLGIKVIMIDGYAKFSEIKSDKNIVLYGYSKQINGSPKNYTTTDLVSRKEKTKCGKNCRVVSMPHLSLSLVTISNELFKILSWKKEIPKN